jgi:Shugoshin C terminus
VPFFSGCASVDTDFLFMTESTNMPPSPKKRPAADIAGQKDQAKFESLVEKLRCDTTTPGIEKDEKDGISDQRLATDASSNDRIELSAAEETLPPTAMTELISHSELNEPCISQHQDISKPDSSASASTSRPARRPRGNVNYAEPNLRDKMRRATNELVDAVGGEQLRRASTSQADKKNASDSGTSITKTKSGTSTVKAEGSEASLSGSSHDSQADRSDNIGQFHTLSQLPTTVNTERKRRTLSANKEELVQSQDSNATIGGWSTSLLGNRKTADRRRRRESGRTYINMDSEMSDRQAYMSHSKVGDNSEFAPLAVASGHKILGITQQSGRLSSNSESIQQGESTQQEVKQKALYHQLDVSGRLSGKLSGNENEAQYHASKSRHEWNSLDEDDNASSQDRSTTKTVAGQTKQGQRVGVRRRSMML